ncbi:hypothetical protein [Persicobacter diffluens]|uniref:DNA-binding transcriptional activator n=1 Tax=Persicobacter diffluens TaxID=981 RepID=A0AAN4W260_9BACT|nr:hypothetical protein PEDI_31070 [Persicobacter diffluens]
MRNLYIFFFFLLPYLSWSNPIDGQPSIGGLDFMSSEKKPSEISTLILPRDKYLPADPKMNISFEMELKDSPILGNILRLISEENVLDLKFEPTNNRPYAALIILGDFLEKEIKIKIPKDLLEQRLWQLINIEIDQYHQKLLIRVGDQEFQTSLTQPLSESVQLHFGACKVPGYTTRDVPGFSLRNIHFTSGTHVYHWPLNQSEGEIVIETEAGYHGQIIHPNWLALYHHYWQEVAVLENNFQPAIFHDSLENQLHIVGSNKQIIFDFNKEQLVQENTLEFQSQSPLLLNGLNIQGTDQGLLYDVRGGKTIDYHYHQQPNFNHLDNDLPLDYWHQSLFYDIYKNQAYTFGGYGYFTFKKDFRYFDNKKQQWANTAFKGDEISPRYLAAIGYLEDNKYLLFGGHGNLDGDQAKGTQIFHDLYEIDLKNQSVKKRWDLKKTHEMVPGHHLVVSHDRKHFFTLMHSANEPKDAVKLAKINLENGNLEWVSNGIPNEFKDTESTIKLFHHPKSHRFYAVLKHGDYNQDHSEIKIYKLQGSPRSAAQLAALDIMPEEKSNYYFLAVLLLLIPLPAWWWIKRKKNATETVVAPKQNFETRQVTAYEPLVLNEQNKALQNAIYLFGGFKIFDKEGNDISGEVTEKLRQLLLIILFHPYIMGRGISSQEMVDILWPGAPKSKSKNNRSISIRRLRLILQKCEGIEITFQNGEWLLDVSSGAYCDFEAFVNLRNQLKAEDKENQINQLSALYEIIHSGIFVANSKLDWLENTTSHIQSDIIDILILFAHQCKNPLWVCDIADVIFKFDELEEQGLSLKILALAHLGKNVQAHNEYDRFSNQYEKLFGEPYEKSFQSLSK